MVMEGVARHRTTEEKASGDNGPHLGVEQALTDIGVRVRPLPQLFFSLANQSLRKPENKANGVDTDSGQHEVAGASGQCVTL